MCCVWGGGGRRGEEGGLEKGKTHIITHFAHSPEYLLDVPPHVQLLENPIALVQDEMLDLIEIQGFLPHELQNTPGGSNHNVGAIVLAHVLVQGNLDSTIENGSLDSWQIFREPLVLVSNLEGKLAGVAKDQHRNLTINRLQLVQGGKHKDGSLAHTRFGLAHNVHTKNSLRNALVLNLRRMLKTAVDNRLQALGFQNEVVEARGMDTNIVTFLGLLYLSNFGFCLLLLHSLSRKWLLWVGGESGGVGVKWGGVGVDRIQTRLLSWEEIHIMEYMIVVC